MVKSKKSFVFIELLLAGLLLLLVSFMLREKNGKNRERVSVIVEDSEGGQWAAFRYGLRMAAEDQGIEVYVVSTPEVLSPEDEEKLMERELENGADALLVQPVPGMEAESFWKKTRAPVMLIGYALSAEETGEKLPVTQPDHDAMGRDLAEALLEDYGEDLTGKTLGIVWQQEESGAAAIRRRGFEERLEGSGIEVIWAVSCQEESLLEQQPRASVVVALDDGSFIMAGVCAAENDLHGAVVYGIGNSARAVYYLDTGAAKCLVVPDDFMMGYQSLTEVAGKLEGSSGQMESSVVRHSVMRRDNLFTKENQELLYTMSQ